MDPAKLKRNNRSQSSARPAGGGGGQSATAAGAGRSTSRATTPTGWGAGLLTYLYGQAGFGLEVVGANREQPGPEAAGRVMQFQAPAAGEQLDRVLRRRVPIYRRVTEASGASILDDLGPLVFGPILAGVMASNPAMMEMFAPMFLSVMQASAADVVRILKRQEAQMSSVAEHGEEAAQAAKDLLRDMFGLDEPEQAESERESGPSGG